MNQKHELDERYDIFDEEVFGMIHQIQKEAKFLKVFHLLFRVSALFLELCCWFLYKNSTTLKWWGSSESYSMILGSAHIVSSKLTIRSMKTKTVRLVSSCSRPLQVEAMQYTTPQTHFGFDVTMMFTLYLQPKYHYNHMSSERMNNIKRNDRIILVSEEYLYLFNLYLRKLIRNIMRMILPNIYDR